MRRKLETKPDPSTIRRSPAEEKRIKQLYGIDENRYQQILLEQSGVCAICKKHQRSQRLCIDHSHKTGKVRGLLCTRCNRNIGRFYDSINLLQSAADYLRKHEL